MDEPLVVIDMGDGTGMLADAAHVARMRALLLAQLDQPGYTDPGLAAIGYAIELLDAPGRVPFPDHDDDGPFAEAARAAELHRHLLCHRPAASVLALAATLTAPPG